MFGGVSGHAGLFSDAYDLAVIMQMLMNGGTIGGHQYLKKETIDYFTAYHSDISRRGLGFDKPEKDNATRKEPYPCADVSPANIRPYRIYRNLRLGGSCKTNRFYLSFQPGESPGKLQAFFLECAGKYYGAIFIRRWSTVGSWRLAVDRLSWIVYRVSINDKRLTINGLRLSDFAFL